MFSTIFKQKNVVDEVFISVSDIVALSGGAGAPREIYS